MTYTITVHIGDQVQQLNAEAGTNLRRLLMMHDISPYGPLPQRINCGGRGLCATCGVWIDDGSPAPTHWHDRIGSRFGYPRLSCQITINGDMTVHILSDKRFWGQRDPDRSRRARSDPQATDS